MHSAVLFQLTGTKLHRDSWRDIFFGLFWGGLAIAGGFLVTGIGLAAEDSLWHGWQVNSLQLKNVSPGTERFARCQSKTFDPPQGGVVVWMDLVSESIHAEGSDTWL